MFSSYVVLIDEFIRPVYLLIYCLYDVFGLVYHFAL